MCVGVNMSTNSILTPDSDRYADVRAMYGEVTLHASVELKSGRISLLPLTYVKIFQDHKEYVHVEPSGFRARTRVVKRLRRRIELPAPV